MCDEETSTQTHDRLVRQGWIPPGTEQMGITASWPPTHRHRMTGKLYRVIGHATHSETLERLTIYVGEDLSVWARPSAMFEDGRFVSLSGPPAARGERT